MTERLFTVLGRGRTACHGGPGKWPLGEWLEVTASFVSRELGLHLYREWDLVYWLGPEIWEVAYEGERVDCDDKVVVRRARLIRKLTTWNERTARLFMCDCAERVLPIYAALYPDDNRPRVANETARRYATGAATEAELKAVRDAACAAEAATRKAAYAVGLDAVYTVYAAAWAAAYAARAAEAATREAVYTAVRDAAYAAYAAVGAAERKWQTARLMGYLYPLAAVIN